MKFREHEKKMIERLVISNGTINLTHIVLIVFQILTPYVLVGGYNLLLVGASKTWDWCFILSWISRIKCNP
jgi:hypothetical protein